MSFITLIMSKSTVIMKRREGFPEFRLSKTSPFIPQSSFFGLCDSFCVLWFLITQYAVFFFLVFQKVMVWYSIFYKQDKQKRIPGTCWRTDTLYSEDFISEVKSVSSLMLAPLPPAAVTHLLPMTVTPVPLPEMAIPFQEVITVCTQQHRHRQATQRADSCAWAVCDERNKTKQLGKGCLKFSFSFFVYKSLEINLPEDVGICVYNSTICSCHVCVTIKVLRNSSA